MKHILSILIVVFIISIGAKAQQRLDPQQMSFVPTQKPNSIYYNDTLYKGSKEFQYLFYRTLNKDIIALYNKHQSNKIWGNVLTTLGTLATTTGVIMATSKNGDKTAGWIILGGGLACTATGGYLILQGQVNLIKAVSLFNYKYAKTQVGIGVGNKQAGLIVNF
ncbi:MAG: hypothetical protein JSR09_08000 [Bacteroidetes bacterium]|nr:hypothetical protein [Bacteroidota bacterium]MBS1649636.1 hypothetical protein [Bacteroidota bacterium]